MLKQQMSGTAFCSSLAPADVSLSPQLPCLGLASQPRTMRPHSPCASFTGSSGRWVQGRLQGCPVTDPPLPDSWIHSSFSVAQRLKRLPAMQETWVRSLGAKIPWRRKWQTTPVFLPGDSHGRRGLVGYSPRGRKESDTTEQFHLLSLSLLLGLHYQDPWCSSLVAHSAFSPQ